MDAITHQWPFTLWETGPISPAHPATLIYRAATPNLVELAVEHAEQPDDEDVTTSYQVALNQLAEGLKRRVSDGNATIRPHDTVPDWVVVKLATYSDTTEFYADAVVIKMFVDRIAFLGEAETFDVDALAARLLEVSA